MLNSLVFTIQKIYADAPRPLEAQPDILQSTVEESRDMDFSNQQSELEKPIKLEESKSEIPTNGIKENPSTV